MGLCLLCGIPRAARAPRSPLHRVTFSCVPRQLSAAARCTPALLLGFARPSEITGGGNEAQFRDVIVGWFAEQLKTHDIKPDPACVKGRLLAPVM